jgi:hypothetical protein
MKKFFLLFCLSGLVSCGFVHDDNINDKEAPSDVFSTNVLNNLVNVNTIMRDNAISPNYISHLDSANNFSLGFNFGINELKHKEVSKVRVTVSCYFPRAGKASIICAVIAGDSAVYWNAIPVDLNAGLNKWGGNDVIFDLQKTYDGNERISAYVWSPDKDELYVGELNVFPME